MIMSVSTLIIFSGAATPSRVVNLSIAVSLLPGCAGFSANHPLAKVAISAAFLHLRHRIQLRRPRPCRAEPDLPFGDELIALPQDADAQHIHRLRAVAGRGRIDRRAAGGTEGLGARIAAFRRGANVDRGLSLHLEAVAGDGNRNAERRCGPGLAIGAMTNHRLLRIGFGFDADRPAQACAVDFHASSSSSAAFSMASMSSSDRPKWWPISCTSTCVMIKPKLSSCSAQ